jgi:cytochrome c oxidase assembly factor CtaG
MSHLIFNAVAHVAFVVFWSAHVSRLPEPQRSRALRALWPRVVSTLFLFFGVTQAIVLIAAPVQDEVTISDVGPPSSSMLIRDLSAGAPKCARLEPPSMLRECGVRIVAQNAGDRSARCCR